MKYNIGDLVWVIHDEMILCGEVIIRSITERATASSEEYTLRFKANTNASFFVRDVYETLEELVNAKTVPYES
jgi:hypothetical protein